MYEQFYIMLYDMPASGSEASGHQEQSFSRVRKGKATKGARQPPDFKDNEFRGWQTIPAMRKLHNIAVWLRNSSIHCNLWEDRVGLRLGIDNDTRWNSWYKLIDNLVRKQTQIKQSCLITIRRSTIIFSTHWIGITLKKHIDFSNRSRWQLYGLRVRILHYRRYSQLWMVYYATMKRIRFAS
jgi:hypothetical protein